MSISPKEFIASLIALVRTKGAKAYVDYSDAELIEHFITQTLNTELQVRFSGYILDCVCTWLFNHKEKKIFVVGLIGDKNFIRFMRKRWKAEYPDYSVYFLRRGKIRKHSTH